MDRRRILSCGRFFILDYSNGASVGSFDLLRSLSGCGFGVEALCGSVVDALHEGNSTPDFGALNLASSSAAFRTHSLWTINPQGVHQEVPPHLRTTINGVPITALDRPLRRNTPTDPVEAAEFLSLYDATLKRFRPDVVITYGGDALTMEILARARRSMIKSVFYLHNFGYPSPEPFVNVDAILVPSEFSAEHHRRVLRRECVAIPYLVDAHRVRADRTSSGYVTFVNPSFEKGLFWFVRIADELGRRRPDIPLLVVESRASESTLVGCGIDLRPHGNVFLMGQTSDPRDFWRETRICLMPSLWWESQGLVAVEAMINGIPVIASDRGALPETLGNAGITLPIPDRITPATRILPTAEEVTPWVDAVIRLWDDAAFYKDHQRRAFQEAERWSPEVLEPRYVQFFHELASARSRV